MAGWKGVVCLAGNRHAMEMAANRQSIRSPLVEDRFEQVRQYAHGERRRQNVVAVPAPRRGALVAVEPPGRRDCQQDVLVRPPRQQLSGLLGLRTCMIRNGIRDHDVAARRRDPIGSHCSSSVKHHGYERLR
jgi:hypothetical protein